MTYQYYISPSGLALHNRLWEAMSRVDALVDARAEAAQKEIHAMAVRDRRAIGQLTRRDHFWRRAGK